MRPAAAQDISASQTMLLVKTYRQEGVFVTTELQVSIALLVVLHMHGLCVCARQKASPHGFKACVRLCEVNASYGDAVPRLHTACQLTLHLQVQAARGSPLRHLPSQCHTMSSLVNHKADVDAALVICHQSCSDATSTKLESRCCCQSRQKKYC